MVFHHAARMQTGFPRLALPYGTYRSGSLRTSPRFASPRTLRLQGLITLLASFSFRTLWTLFQIQAPLGFSPSESCSLPRSRAPLRAFLLSCRLFGSASEDPLPEPRLQSFAPRGRAALAAGAINAGRSRSSPGVGISEACSLASLLPLRVNSSFALHPQRRSKPPMRTVP
jgi:hypothetical protein